jgi:hypothetical protein
VKLEPPPDLFLHRSTVRLGPVLMNRPSPRPFRGADDDPLASLGSA